jgi:antigen 43
MANVTLPDSYNSTEYYSGSGMTLVNTGVEAGPRGSSSHVNLGFYITGNNDTFVNNGTVFGQRVGVYFKGGTGDSLINNAGKAIITTYPDQAGVNFYTARGTVTNYGSISGYASAVQPQNANAVELLFGGLVTNTGMLSNGGVFIGAGTGTVINSGVILGNLTDGGVYLKDGGTITNQAGGLISDQGATNGYAGVAPYGVWLKGGGTITNAGTITGGGASGTTGYAVRMDAGVTNKVIVDPGAVFNGAVNGGTAADSTLELASGSSTGTLSGFGTQFTNFGTLTFDPSASWLLQTSTAISSTTINGFVETDTIDITGFTATSISTLTGNTGVVLTDAGGDHVTLSFGGSIGNFGYTNGPSGTDLTTICFCTDTQIATPSGEVPVQTLKPGDIVLTAHNGPRPVAWVGTGKVLATSGKRGVATPVIVRKGALADNLPHRDLHVTKAHSLYIDDVLIPVEFLVNHKTILWDDRAQEVEIYHIELETHDLLIANGVPAESYRDDGNRWLFQNANSGWHLPPQEPYAPVLTGGPIVDAAWQRFLDRAGPRDTTPLTDDPDLHLIIDGRRIDARERRDGAYIFLLPSAPGSVFVASRTGVPSELGTVRDPRSLGVALRQLTIRQGAKFMLFDADDERLTAGFHDYEPSDRLRWTDGYAELPAETFARFDQGAVVTLYLGGATQYPDDRDHAEQVAA